MDRWGFLVFAVGFAAGIFFLFMLLTIFPNHKYQKQGREQVLNGEVVCVRDNSKWECKNKSEIEEELKFLSKLQPNKQENSR